MLYVHARSFIVRLLLCLLLTTFPLLLHPPAMRLVQQAESLGTGAIPTMGINDVTEGTLLFKTNQLGRYIPAPLLKTDVQIALAGIIARATSCHHTGRTATVCSHRRDYGGKGRRLRAC